MIFIGLIYGFFCGINSVGVLGESCPNLVLGLGGFCSGLGVSLAV